jgi:hypothetical protein
MHVRAAGVDIAARAYACMTFSVCAIAHWRTIVDEVQTSAQDIDQAAPKETS